MAVFLRFFRHQIVGSQMATLWLAHPWPRSGWLTHGHTLVNSHMTTLWLAHPWPRSGWLTCGHTLVGSPMAMLWELSLNVSKAWSFFLLVFLVAFRLTLSQVLCHGSAFTISSFPHFHLFSCDQPSYASGCWLRYRLVGDHEVEAPGPDWCSRFRWICARVLHGRK